MSVTLEPNFNITALPSPAPTMNSAFQTLLAATTRERCWLSLFACISA